jgi:hypothetical protein
VQNLRSAAGLAVVGNPILANLAGLDGLQTLGGAPVITDNALLPACWAERVAGQVGQSCSCGNNTGSEACP